MVEARLIEAGAAREGILALYRAHAGARQLPLEHVRRIVRRDWHGREYSMPRTSGASIRRALALAEAFYLRHQPFRSDRTIYVAAGEVPGAAALTIGGVAIDRIALTSRGAALHFYARETVRATSMAELRWSDADEGIPKECVVTREGLEVAVVEHDLFRGVHRCSRLTGIRRAGSMMSLIPSRFERNARIQ